MEIIDLRTKQCPMALVILKRYLLQNDIAEKSKISRLCVLFSNEQAMQDIMLYLDKKGYDYSTSVLDNNVSLHMQLK